MGGSCGTAVFGSGGALFSIFIHLYSVWDVSFRCLCLFSYRRGHSFLGGAFYLCLWDTPWGSCSTVAGGRGGTVGRVLWLHLYRYEMLIAQCSVMFCLMFLSMAVQGLGPPCMHWVAGGPCCLCSLGLVAMPCCMRFKLSGVRYSAMLK